MPWPLRGRQTAQALRCQFAELEKELARGPAVHGWKDQRWTVARIRAVIAFKFQVDCSMAAVWRKKDVWPQVE